MAAKGDTDLLPIWTVFIREERAAYAAARQHWDRAGLLLSSRLRHAALPWLTWIRATAGALRVLVWHLRWSSSSSTLIPDSLTTHMLTTSWVMSQGTRAGVVSPGQQIWLLPQLENVLEERSNHHDILGTRG